MKSHRISQLLRPAMVLVVVVALVATACGSGAVETAGGQSAVPSGPATALTPGASSDTTSDSGSGGSSSTGGVLSTAPGSAFAEGAGNQSTQHGLSLDEFGDNIGGITDSPPRRLPSEAGFTQINWEDLIAPGRSPEEVFKKFEDRLAEVEYGSQEANDLYDEIDAEFNTDATNPEIAGQQIRLAGFVAPLTFVDEVITEFLLVPNFGACIHVPPPPPNQTVMVTLTKDNGLTLNEALGAIWVEGTMAVDTSNTELAEASYVITSAVSGVYEF